MDSSDLANKKCIPCEIGTPPMPHAEAERLLAELGGGWVFADAGKKIRRERKFADFMEAMTFVNRVAEVAETEGHHPDIGISYATVSLELWTHASGGLTENDFILAAKIDAL
jgi:4a-hydroxytetrahydrobiopterin dehydratase